MQIYYINDSIPNDVKCSVALGRFDGVHKAHRRLVAAASESARALGDGVRSAVFTFSDETPGRITDLDEKARIFEALGVDVLFLAPFESIRSMSPSEFFETVLKRLGCVSVVHGFNYHFGKGALGDRYTMAELCRESGVVHTVIERVTDMNDPVSSTLIRELIVQGKVQRAGELLSEPFSLHGEVMHGYGRGRDIGFPTLNVEYPSGKIQLKNGVYLSRCLVGGIEYPSLTNVGYNPTLPKEKLMTETHLIDAKGDFYGLDARISFLDFIREERRMHSLEALSMTLASDLRTAIEGHKKTEK